MGAHETPRYDLDLIKLLVRSGRWTIGLTPAQHVRQMDMDVEDVADCLLRLRAEDYYKSLPCDHFPGVWQDVYRPAYGGRSLYVKVQCDEEVVTVAAFKRR
jgi:MqsR (Motility quorum-sensing regulator) toxin of toxin-antitoxin system